MSYRDAYHDLGLEYLEALHGVQTGVAYEMNIGGKAHEPKHLRTGINSAMINDAALVLLLLEKGIITAEEYEEAVRLVANNEVWRYEQLHPGITFR